MMTLFELTGEYLELLNLAEDDEIGSEAIQDTLEAIQGEIEIKADNIACVIKMLKAEEAALKNEAKSLSERAKSKFSKREKLIEYLHQQMNAIGKVKIETTRNAISIRKSPPAVKVHDEAGFINWAQSGHEEYLNYQTPEIKKSAVKEAIAKGDTIPNVTLEQGETLYIK